MTSNKDKASIALHYVANNKIAECNQLVATIPFVDIKGLDPEFSSPYGTGLLFAGAWGNEHWKNMTLRMAALCKYIAENDKLSETAQKAALEHEVFESRLLAMDEALNVICTMYGIFPGDIRLLASNADEFEPLDKKIKPDEVYKNELVDHYLAMMKSWPSNHLQISVPIGSAH